MTVTVTVTVTLTPNNEKRKVFDSNVCLNHILKWRMTCEASVGVSVNTVKVLSDTIFSCAGDRLSQFFSSYVEL